MAVVDPLDLGQNLLIGIEAAFSLRSLAFCLAGVTLGMLVGVLPGIGIMSTIAILMPLTFHVDPTSALIMLAGIYYGAAYGGSTAAILLNVPGSPQAAVTCLDGYPMAKQGRAGVALFITTIASFVGSIVGVLILSLLAPPLAAVAMMFGSPEYFSLMLFGVLAASLLTSTLPFRALATIAFGLLLGVVGIDVSTGQERFTFGLTTLLDGLPLVAVVLGMFSLPEIFDNVVKRKSQTVVANEITFRSMLPTRDDWYRSWKAILRGTGIGSLFGALPGTGGLIASFMSYALEKKLHPRPQEFGKGAIEGVSGPEAANNAAVQTAFIPTLTLGIPGDAVMALMLGVLMIHNVIPGPQFVSGNPEMFWGLVISFLIGNVILVLLNIPLIQIWVRILSIPYGILFPSIIVFICIGVYSVRYNVTDVFVVLTFGIIAYGMRILNFQTPPLIIGLVLGPMMEENFRRSMQLSRGDPTVFLERPISGTILMLSCALLGWAIFSAVRSKKN